MDAGGRIASGTAIDNAGSGPRFDKDNYRRMNTIGVWPSGKAPGFDPGIPRFESWHPSQTVAEI